ncbi:MAG: DNA recombination protein RmuC [Patescibacteria group bacterium]
MNTETLVFAILIVLLNAGVVWFFLRKKQEETKPSQGLDLVLQQINELSRTVDMKLGENAKTMHESIRAQLGESTRIVKEVTEGLTKLDETNKQVVSFADQLQSLQDILQNSKQRGALGEYYLEKVLQDIFAPDQYVLQYPFQNGEIVDAVIFLRDKKVLPIDSKFSLENYRRLIESRDAEEKIRLEKAFVNDLKLRIKETSKYIRPAENTMDFAFMFIPSESIYYDLLSNKVGVVGGDDGESNLIQRAYKEYKVIIVSPTTFVAYLQTVLQGLRGLQIEEQAKEIQKRVGELGRHIANHNAFMLKLGNALGTTVNHFNTAHKELGKIDKDVVRIAGETGGIEILSIEKPQVEE